ncbi:hypothetical protein V8E55_000856 [Tylopilus felleus]
MVAAKCYLALLLACLIQVSLALPTPPEPVARHPVEGPVPDYFGGSGGGAADW